MLTTTDEPLDYGRIDREPFIFKHKLTGHPALTLENLSRVIPALPKQNVFYSAGLSRLDNFDKAHIEKANGLTIEQTIEQIRTSDSYIMVRSPERDPSFHALFQQLLADVNEMTGASGGASGDGTKLYMFIAAPGAVTPFHFDRNSTLLFQFRGQKNIWVAPPWDERVVSAADKEAFVARSGRRPLWRDEMEALGTAFHFSPGEALHIPFISPHYVRNGTDDVSISLSIIFNTRATAAQLRALEFNHAARTRGFSPARVGASGARDAAKSAAWRCASYARRKYYTLRYGAADLA
jgi:hypothetical protein